MVQRKNKTIPIARKSAAAPTRQRMVGFYGKPECYADLERAGAHPIFGDYAETIEHAVEWWRGESGRIAIAEDLRCLCNGEGKPTRREIFEIVRQLEKRKIQLVDIRDETADHLTLIERTQAAMQASGAMGSRKTAQRRGRKGGVAKKENAAARRNARIDDEIAIRICTFDKLTWDDKVYLLGMPRSTLIRYYKPH